MPVPPINMTTSHPQYPQYPHCPKPQYLQGFVSDYSLYAVEFAWKNLHEKIGTLPLKSAEYIKVSFQQKDAGKR